MAEKQKKNTHQAIQVALKAPKENKNNFGGYSYRSAEDILDALKPHLAEHGATVTLTDEIVLIGERYYTKATATLTTSDGTQYSTTAYAREEESKKGMDGSQITGAASSYARKYALNGLFAIDDTKDSDATNQGEDKASATQSNQSSKEAPKQPTAQMYEEIRNLKTLSEARKYYQQHAGKGPMTEAAIMSRVKELRQRKLTHHRRMRLHRVEQNSPEWYALREARLTASHAQAIANNGKGLDTYVTQLMAEYHSTAPRENFSNEHTERGHELEDQARTVYVLLQGVSVEQVGFVEYDEYVGCSPDGLVGEDGLLEIKCLMDVKHYTLTLEDEPTIESRYLWQCQMQLLVTGRAWRDLAFYNPNYRKSLLVFRQYPDREKQEKLEVGLEKGRAEIKKQIT